MNAITLKKTIAIITLLVVVANLLLFAFNIFSLITFWIIIIVCAIIAFPGMKMLDKQKAQKTSQRKK